MENLFGNSANMREIGRGKSGGVVKSSAGNQAAYKYFKTGNLQELENEKRITELAADLGVAPPLVGANPIVIVPTSDGQWAMRIRMKKLNEKQGIRDYARKVSGGKMALEEIKGYVRILNNNGICHRDLHEYNIMCDNDRMYIIDYGKAQFSLNSRCSEDSDSIASFEHNPSIYKIKIPDAAQSSSPVKTRKILKFMSSPEAVKQNLFGNERTPSPPPRTSRNLFRTPSPPSSSRRQLF